MTGAGRDLSRVYSIPGMWIETIETMDGEDESVNRDSEVLPERTWDLRAEHVRVSAVPE